MDINVVREARRKKCATECRALANWLLDRANLLDRELTDDQNTLIALGKHIGRMRADIDQSGWATSVEHPSQFLLTQK